MTDHLNWTTDDRIDLESDLGSSIECGAFSRDKKYFAIGSTDGTIRIWDVALQKTVANFGGHRNLVSGITFSPDGKVLASASFDNAIKLWSVTTAENLATLRGHTGFLLAMAFSNDGGSLASIGGDKTIRMWECAAKLDTDILVHNSGVYSTAFSTDGKMLAAMCADGTIALWRMDPCEKIGTIPGEPNEAGFLMSFSPDGKTLFSQGANETSISTWNLATKQKVASLKVPGAVLFDWCLSADGRFVATASDDRTARLWDSSNQSCGLLP